MTTEPIDHRRDKYIVLAGLTVYWFLTGLFTVLISPTGPAWGVTFFVTSIGWGIGILMWCRSDADERSDVLSGGEKIAIVAFGGLALLWYLFHTRGATGGLKAIGWLVLYLVSGIVVNTVVLTIAMLLLKAGGVTLYDN